MSRLVFRLPDGGVRVWEGRHHRKRRADIGRADLWRMLWEPAAIEWWVAALFTIGSTMFAVGSFAGLGPAALAGVSGDLARTNSIFFAGSIFFTAASCLQLLESINADRKIEPGLRFRWFAWWPGRIGWLASLIQLIGALLFNVNTFDALLPIPGWLRQDTLIWSPDFVGSVCFMAAGQLAVLELCHGWWCLRPSSLSWWVVLVNWIGSGAFLGSAFLAFIPPGEEGPFDAWWSTCLTFVGAICFLSGSMLLLPETVSGDAPSRDPAC